MSSQLDYWKAMNAKNAELMSQGSRIPKDFQADTNAQSGNPQSYDRVNGSRFHGEPQQRSPEQLRDQSSNRFHDQARRSYSDGQVRRGEQARYSYSPRRNVVDSYSLDSSTVQKETEHIQVSAGKHFSRERSSFEPSSYEAGGDEARQAQRVHHRSGRLQYVGGSSDEISYPRRAVDGMYEISQRAGESRETPQRTGESHETLQRAGKSSRVGGEAHEPQQARSRSGRRAKREDRMMRSQDYLLSRDDEFVTAPSEAKAVTKTGLFAKAAASVKAKASAKTDPSAKAEVSTTGEAPIKAEVPTKTEAPVKGEAPAKTKASTKTKAPKDARNLGKSYLPGLDGLRCIAVLAVLLYHISPNQFVGGYIGVDLFFVISGFLITYLNLQKIENPNKTFSLKNFWLRRARRLIPALVLVILVCVPLGAIIYPDILVGVFRQVAGALTYTTNWVEIIHGSNYFDQANPSLFKNFWSLAVEEQFYLIWPPILLLLMSRRLRNSQLISIIAAVGLASLILMGVLATPDNYTRVYYGTDTHCFGLAFGIIFAFIWNRQEGLLSREWITSQKWTVALAPVGLIGFALIVMLVPDTAAFTYPFGLGLGSLFSLFLLGSVIIRQDSLFTRIMELAPMRWVGVRSYSIYLWHWPMLVFGRILVPTALGTVENVLVDVLFAAISFVASDLSYRFVEEPLRKDGFIKSVEKLYDRVREGIVGRIQAAVCVVLVIATIVAIATAPEKTQLQIQIEQQQAAQEQAAQEAAAAAAAEAEKGAIPNYDEAQMTGIPEGSTITAIGDSLISGNSIGFEEQFSGINFLAEPIRQWEQGVEVVRAGIDQGLIRQNVILDFGTNGGVKDEALVRQVLDALGPDRRILLYNIYSPSSFVEESNAIYEKLADEYPNVYLVDWNAVAAAHPEYLNSDRTHTNIEGQNAFVDAAKSVFSES